MLRLSHRKHTLGHPGMCCIARLAFWISGFRAWIGMLFVDHYHTNPVLVSFCHILITGHRDRSLQRAIKYKYLNQSAGESPV